ncbi:MAG: tetratricopeptide repeat protein, partial [Blastocatellia bacterium]
MTREVPFIGRKDELKQIEQLIREEGASRVVCVSGPGGIGKTRLLEEIRKQFASDANSSLLIPGVIDFDDIALQIPENVERRIARGLDEKSFENYFLKMLDLRRMETAGVSVETLEDFEEQVLRILVEDFNKITTSRRVVLLFDTTEKLEKEVWRRHIDLVLAAQGALFVFAGRDVSYLLSKLGDKAIHIALKPLETEDSREYLRHKQELLHTTIAPGIAQKLLLLAEGRPILLDLAIEWVSRGLPPDWMTEKSFDEITSLPSEEFEELRRDFKIQLVRHVRQIRNPMDQLTLVMSRVYPINREMISELLKVTEDRADELFKEATGYVFVKELSDKYLSLHDEMREMINEHVWPEVDKDGDRQRRDSEMASARLKQEIRGLTTQSNKLAERQEKARDRGRMEEEMNIFITREELDREMWALKEQWVFHTLFTDVKKGVGAFIEVFEEASKKHRIPLQKLLLEQVEAFRGKFSGTDPYEVDIRMVRWMLDSKRTGDAKQKLDSLMKDYADGGDREVNMLTRLASYAKQSGSLPDAISHLERALSICESDPVLQQSASGIVLNSLGWMNRLMGRWKKAEDYYKQGIEGIRRTGDQAKLASAYNNYGYIVGLQSNYDTALIYCREALKIQEKLELKFDVGRTQNTLGIIHRGKEDYTTSLKHTEQAIAIFHELKNNEWLSNAYCERGATKWHMGQLKEADEDLDTSHKLCASKTEMVNILHRKAHVAWELGKIQEAEAYFLQSADLAREVSD